MTTQPLHYHCLSILAICAPMLVIGTARAIAQEVVVPPINHPTSETDPSCGGSAVTELFDTAADYAQSVSKGTVTANDAKWAFHQSGLVRSSSANCVAIAKTVHEDSELWINFGGRDIKHPFYCQGYRTGFHSKWAAVEDMQWRPLQDGKYLLIAKFKNWSHDQSLTVSIDEFEMGQGWNPWFPHCGTRDQNRINDR